MYHKDGKLKRFFEIENKHDKKNSVNKNLRNSKVNSKSIFESFFRSNTNRSADFSIEILHPFYGKIEKNPPLEKSCCPNLILNQLQSASTSNLQQHLKKENL